MYATMKQFIFIICYFQLFKICDKVFFLKGQVKVILFLRVKIL